jgi:hypothetical protein
MLVELSIILKGKDVDKMPDIKPEDIKETTEVPSQDEAKRLEGLGWVTIDTYKMNENMFYILAWAKDGAPAR